MAYYIPSHFQLSACWRRARSNYTQLSSIAIYVNHLIFTNKIQTTAKTRHCGGVEGEICIPVAFFYCYYTAYAVRTLERFVSNAQCDARQSNMLIRKTFGRNSVIGKF